MRKIIAFLLIVMVVAMVGCGKEDTKSNIYDNEKEKNVELDKVTFILDWAPNTNHTGIYAAIELGYFEEQGIEVDVIQPAGGSAEVLVASGQGEFGVSFQETLSIARNAENPVPAVAIATILQHNTSGFAGLSDKAINTPKDFEGKTYGSWGTEAEIAFINTMMEKENADIDQLDIIDIMNYDFLGSIQNDVDFQWIYYGWDGIAAEVKGVDINFIKLQDVDERLDFYTPIIITSEDLIASNPDLITRFLAATAKGYEFCVNEPETAVEYLLKYAPETDVEIAKASQKYLADEYIADADAWGVMKDEVWTTFSTWMLENGVLNSELDVEKAYTNEFLPGANK